MKIILNLLVCISISSIVLSQSYKIDFKKDLYFIKEDSSNMIIKKVNVSGGDKKNYLCKVVWSVGKRKDLLNSVLLEKLVKFSSMEASFAATNRLTYKPIGFNIMYSPEKDNFLIGVDFSAKNSYGVEKQGKSIFYYTLEGEKIDN